MFPWNYAALLSAAKVDYVTCKPVNGQWGTDQNWSLSLLKSWSLESGEHIGWIRLWYYCEHTMKSHCVEEIFLCPTLSNLSFQTALCWANNDNLLDYYFQLQKDLSRWPLFCPLYHVNRSIPSSLPLWVCVYYRCGWMRHWIGSLSIQHILLQHRRLLWVQRSVSR